MIYLIILFTAFKKFKIQWFIKQYKNFVPHTLLSYLILYAGYCNNSKICCITYHGTLLPLTILFSFLLNHGSNSHSFCSSSFKLLFLLHYWKSLMVSISFLCRILVLESDLIKFALTLLVNLLVKIWNLFT